MLIHIAFCIEFQSWSVLPDELECFTKTLTFASRLSPWLCFDSDCKHQEYNISLLYYISFFNVTVALLVVKDWFALWQYVFHRCLSMFVEEIPDSDVNTIYTRFIELFEDCCARYAIQTWLKTRSKIILHLGNAPDQALIFRNSVWSVCEKQKIIFLRKRNRHFYCFWCNWVILWRLWRIFILFRIIILH